MKYAGFWERSASILIDSAVLSPFILLRFWLDTISKTTGLVAAVSYIIFVAAYDIWFVAKYGQTPGKMAVDIKIVKADGELVSWKEAFLRHSVNIVFAIVTGIVLCYAIKKIPGSEYTSLPWANRSRRIYEYYPTWLNTTSNIWIWGEAVVLLFNKKRRALHDYIAGTVVIHSKRGNAATANHGVDPDAANPAAQVTP
jgi:uncharacterized RDD family membrane protein YckC